MGNDIPQKMRDNWDFAKIAEPLLNDIVYEHVLKTFFRSATKQEDTQFCTDVVFMGSSIRLAHRTRRISNTKATRDFTLRMSRPSGHQTEIDKIERYAPSIYVLAWLDGDLLVEWVAIDFIRFIKQEMHRKPDSVRRVHSDGNTFGCWSIASIQLGGCLLAGQANIGQPVIHWYTPSSLLLSDDPLAMQAHCQMILNREKRRQLAWRKTENKNVMDQI